MAEIQEEKQEFRRSLGLLDGTMLVSGGMIGSGILLRHDCRHFRIAQKRTTSRASVSCTTLSNHTDNLHFDNNRNLSNFALH